MAGTLRSLTVWIRAKGMGMFATKTKKAGRAVTALRNQAKQLRSMMLSGLGIFGLIRVMNLASAVTKKQELAEAKLNAVLKATGGAARRTSEQLRTLASDLQALSTVGDEDIINSQAILGTFKQISGRGFERATAAVLDLSQVLGQDMKSAAILVGKALNDPIKGLTALTRSGITFSADQTKAIRKFVAMNQVAKAQGIILKELESQFGGVAEAMSRTTAGRTSQVMNMATDALEGALGHLKFAIVNALTLGKLLETVEAKAHAARKKRAEGRRLDREGVLTSAAKSLGALEKGKHVNPLAFARGLREFIAAAKDAGQMPRGMRSLEQAGLQTFTLAQQIERAKKALKDITPAARMFEKITKATGMNWVDGLGALTDITKAADAAVAANTTLEERVGLIANPKLKATATAQLARLRAAQEAKSLTAEGKRISEAMRTPMEKYFAQLSKLNTLRRAGKLSAEDHARATAKEAAELRKGADAIRKWFKGGAEGVGGFFQRLRDRRADKMRQAAGALSVSLPSAVEGGSMFRGVAAGFREDEMKKLDTERNALLEEANRLNKTKSLVGRVIDWVS